MPETYSDPDFPSISQVEFEENSQSKMFGLSNIDNSINTNNKDNNNNNNNNNNNKYQRKELKRLTDEKGACEPYIGTVCAKYIGQDYVYITDGLAQNYLEQKLQSAFSIISSSTGDNDFHFIQEHFVLCLLYYFICVFV